MDYFSHARHVDKLADKLARSSRRILVCMHGAARAADAALLREIGMRLAQKRDK